MEPNQHSSRNLAPILWTGFWTAVSRAIQVGLGFALLYGAVEFVKWAWIHS